MKMFYVTLKKKESFSLIDSEGTMSFKRRKLILEISNRM